MPETREVVTEDGKGNVLSRQPYTVSDAELQQEQGLELLRKFSSGEVFTVKTSPGSVEELRERVVMLEILLVTVAVSLGLKELE